MAEWPDPPPPPKPGQNPKPTDGPTPASDDGIWSGEKWRTSMNIDWKTLGLLMLGGVFTGIAMYALTVPNPH